MTRYVVRRLLLFVPTLWVIATLTFFLMRLAPGGPFNAERDIPPAARAALAQKYGLDRPLAVIIQSSSAAGKSSLMDAVLALMPDEDCVRYSAMTGQSLFYMGETNLKHKALALVEEEGASRASYALKLLQSEGELTILLGGEEPVAGEADDEGFGLDGGERLLE